ncbi:O-antigen ligase family protein [Flavobacterium sp.]|uniref:O-antigen ligase family protein n=1 Tax=Flavobacterium sp. TaxID=239 RepID=UPI00286E6517|nr:O-antigen ligase family protein [Flavobacterium sp.]
MRNQCSTSEITNKTLSILLYFCSATAVLNIFMMFLQWKHLMASPNQFFATTGMFFSPNQLGIYLSISCLSTIFLWRKATVFWLKIGLGCCGLLIFLGLCVSASRGACISLFFAIGYFLYVLKVKAKPFSNWIMYLGIGVFLAGSFYFIGMISKNKTESTSGRLFTTQRVLKQIAEQPLGYGLNSFSLEYNKSKASNFEKNSNWEEMKNAGYIYKANNDLLELTFELGIFWMALFLFLIKMLFWEKSDGIEIQMGRTILICLLLFSLTTSIITLPVLIIIACICIIIIVNTTQPKLVYEFKNHIIFRFVVMSMIISFAGVLITRITAE